MFFHSLLSEIFLTKSVSIVIPSKGRIILKELRPA